MIAAPTTAEDPSEALWAAARRCVVALGDRSMKFLMQPYCSLLDIPRAQHDRYIRLFLRAVERRAPRG
jgi:hypothetical protein